MKEIRSLQRTRRKKIRTRKIDLKVTPNQQSFTQRCSMAIMTKRCSREKEVEEAMLTARIPRKTQVRVEDAKGLYRASSCQSSICTCKAILKHKILFTELPQKHPKIGYKRKNLPKIRQPIPLFSKRRKIGERTKKRRNFLKTKNFID